MANVFEMAQAQVKNACDKLGMEANVYELLKEPRRVIEVNMPVKMDDGSEKKIYEIDANSIEKMGESAVVSTNSNFGTEEIVKFESDEMSNELINEDEIPFWY